MTTITRTQTTNWIDHTKQLVSDLQGTHTLPLWEQMAKYNPPAPNPKAIPHLWKYDELKPHLLRAGELITEKQAERRVLMLINPALGKSILDQQRKALLCVPLSKYTKADEP
jgi:gentisate 1,2-dioxygenase